MDQNFPFDFDKRKTKNFENPNFSRTQRVEYFSRLQQEVKKKKIEINFTG